MAKKKAMGRGVSALLGNIDNINSANDEGAKEVLSGIVEIEIDRIQINPFQPRHHFDPDALQELSNSIKELGIIQPLTVRKTNSEKFQLVSGERRFRASKLAGLTKVPVYIRIADDQEMLEMALVENIQRQDLNAIEVALSYQRLIDEVKLTQEEMSTRVGKERSTITNYLRLLKLSPKVQEAIIAGNISMGHGRALINLENELQQDDTLLTILTKRLSVRQTEQLVKRIKNPKSNVVKTPIEIGPKQTKIKNLLNEKLDTEIEITENNQGQGRIIINYSSLEDLARISQIFES